MSNRSRAFRRHHRQRMINHALRKTYAWYYPDDYIWGKQYAIKNHNHLAKCSCYMCGNPRHSAWTSGKERLTIQERKVYNVVSEGLSEYFMED